MNRPRAGARRRRRRGSEWSTTVKREMMCPCTREILCFDEGGRIRWVTHYGIERADIDEALDRTRAVLAAGS